MILRNTASQPILIGPLLAVADGAEQTSGAAIAVRKDGTDVGTPAGTLTYVAGGVWQYIPSQGETDCGIMGLILSKALASAVPLNVVTTRLPVQTTGVLPAAVAGASSGLALVSSVPTAATVADAVWADAPAGTPVADIADAVWADAPAGTPVADIAAAVRDVSNTAPAAGSLGEAVNDAGVGGGSPPTAEAIAAQVWADAPAGTPLADIKAQFVEALVTDTYPEPTAIPSWPMSLLNLIRWPSTIARHKAVVTSSQIRIRNDADSADLVTIPHAESGGTYTRDKGT